MKHSERIRILFADDHAIVRDGLRSLFKSEPKFAIVGEASDGEEAVALAAKLKPDVVILDISMPKMTGIEATRIIKERLPKTRILILTIHESEEFILEMVRAGANGYVIKNADKREILSAVRAVATGEPFFSPSVSKILIEGLVKKATEPPPAAGAMEADDLLTRRETEILRYIAEGKTSREIADALHISFSTVNSHRTNLMKKLDIHEKAGLVRYAIQHNIVRLAK